MARNIKDLRWAEVGDGIRVGYRPRATVDTDELPVIVELEVAEESGRLVVESLTARRRPGGPPVTIDVLKSLPMVGLVGFTAQGHALAGLMRVSTASDGSTVTEPMSVEQLDEPERVAVVYRASLLFGWPPTAAVAEDLGVSKDVAAKRVQAARRAGLLAPTSRGRKGA
jgi:hypothetical protein